MADGYRRMSPSGPHHHLRHSPFSRNMAFFVVLLSLAGMIGLFYFYSTVSGELAQARREALLQEDSVRKLKNELLDAHTKIEAEISNVNECRGERTKAETKAEELESADREQRERVKDLEAKLEEKAAEINRLQAQLEAAEKRNKAQQAQMGNVTGGTGRSGGSENIKNLHEIIDALKRRLGEGNSTSAVAASNGTLTSPGVYAVQAAHPLSSINTLQPTTGQHAADEPAGGHSNPLQQVAVPPAASADDKHHLDQQQLHKDIRGDGQGNFAAARQLGGRMKLEEAKKRADEEEKAQGIDAPLIKAAENEKEEIIDDVAGEKAEVEEDKEGALEGDAPKDSGPKAFNKDDPFET